jgi:S1-C subfamily serine protease
MQVQYNSGDESNGERTVNQTTLKLVGLAALLILMILTAGCLGGNDSGDEIQTPEPTQIPALESQPTLTPTNVQIADEPIDNLQDVDEAVIWIEASGPFYDFDYGEIQNLFGQGAGFLIDAAGLAITDSRIVSGADNIVVTLGGSSGNSYNAEVIAFSECENIALLEIDGSGFDYLGWGQDPVRVGQVLYVAGYTQAGGDFTQKKAVMIELDPDEATSIPQVENVILYDVEVDDFLSGAPVLSPWGEVLGIHLSGYSSEEMDYALPAGRVGEGIALLGAEDALNSLGINARPVVLDDYDVAGVWVSAVTKGSLAEAVGIKAGDIVTKLGDQEFTDGGTMKEYCNALGEQSPEDVFGVQVFRYSSGDCYEGQINGNRLVRVDCLDKKRDVPDDEIEGMGGDYLNLNAQDSGEDYFRTEFIVELDNWSEFGTEGYHEVVQTEIAGGKFNFLVNDLYTYFYYIYDLLDVQDVRLEIEATNLGRNNNNVSLICRQSDQGWYEFNISNNGLWWINRFDPIAEFSYVELDSGGSFEINMGQKTNVYAAICAGDQLTLIVNGVEISTVTDEILPGGKIGFSVSSANRTPVRGELEYFNASVP